MTPRQARIGVDIFTVLVVASVGIALAGLVWRLRGDPGTRFSASPVVVRAARPVDIAPLIALAPFGTGPVSGSVQAGNGPLVLRGILLAQPRTASTALISIGDAAPIAFRAGQAVGNATVDAIAIDHVVLASGATRTILGFPDPAQRTAPAIPPADRAPPNAPALPVIASSANGPAMLERFGATLSGAGLAVSNPSAVMRLAGLQAGDQIVAINGTPASAVAHNPGLLQPILAAGSARIDIVRAGERMTISVPVR